VKRRDRKIVKDFRNRTQPQATEALINSPLTKSEYSALINIVKLMNISIKAMRLAASGTVDEKGMFPLLCEFLLHKVQSVEKSVCP
jgi:hypothetical protein